MQMQRINITLPQDVLRQLRMRIPEGKRSEFIATAIASNLGDKKEKLRQLKRSLEINRDFYNKVRKEIEEDFKYADAEIIDKLP